MNLADVSSIITAAGVVGAGMWRVGVGAARLGEAVKALADLVKDHEARIRALEARK